MSRPERNRDRTIDIARGIAVSLVVLGHSLEIFFSKGVPADDPFFSLWRAIYSFHMSLFFFLSGMVYRKRSRSRIVISALSLVLLAILVHVVFWLPSVVLFDRGLWHLLHPIFYLRYFSVVVLWYLVAYAFVLLVDEFVGSLPGSKTIWIGCALGGFVLAYQLDISTNFFQVQAVGAGLAMFVLGRACAGTIQRMPIWCCVPLSVLASLVLCFTYKFNGGCAYRFSSECAGYFGPFAVSYFLGSYGFLPFFLLTAVSGTLAVVLFAKTLAQRKWCWIVGFEALGVRSLDVFLLNGVFFAFLQPSVSKIVSTHFHDAPSALTILLLFVFGQLSLAYLLKPYASLLLNRCVGFLVWLARRMGLNEHVLRY